tara:strand:+ start:1317 stop:1754 length:438 start_codon:yes stop_codon:yes gene_type:complete
MKLSSYLHTLATKIAGGLTLSRKPDGSYFGGEKLPQGGYIHAVITGEPGYVKVKVYDDPPVEIEDPRPFRMYEQRGFWIDTEWQENQRALLTVRYKAPGASRALTREKEYAYSDLKVAIKEAEQALRSLQMSGKFPRIRGLNPRG